MDHINERFVFEQLVRTSSQPGTPQTVSQTAPALEHSWHAWSCLDVDRLGRAGLTAGPHKLLKHKTLILVVHTLAIPA